MKTYQWEFKDGHWRDTWNDDRQAEVRTDDPTTWSMVPDAEAILGICGCGDPSAVGAEMHAYLRRVIEAKASGYEVQAIRQNTFSDVLLAYMAAKLDFTEHGGNIAGAWMHDPGKEWMVLWAAQQPYLPVYERDHYAILWLKQFTAAKIRSKHLGRPINLNTINDEIDADLRVMLPEGWKWRVRFPPSDSEVRIDIYTPVEEVPE